MIRFKTPIALLPMIETSLRTGEEAVLVTELVWTLLREKCFFPLPGILN